MDYIILKDLIDKNFSLNKIARELNYSQTNIRYWLKKFDLRTNLSKMSKIIILLLKKNYVLNVIL